MGLDSILGALAFMVGGYLVGSVRVVDEGEEALVQRLGQYQRTLKPGLNFVVPFMDAVFVETMREQTLDIDPQDVVTRDKASLKADAIIYWRINDLYSAYYRVEDLESALTNLVLSSLRSEIGQLTLDEVISDIGSINDNLRQELRAATTTWGVEIVRVEIQKFDLPKELRDALDRQAAAKAEGQAELARTDAAVKSIQQLSSALSGSADPQQVLQFLIAEKYVNANSEIGKSDNAKILFMNPGNLNEAITDLITNKLPREGGLPPTSVEIPDN
ncbi:SPFH/Band 7/PHB domain protein [filamentous cyanobacterium LEGE 11480]|uniref:SPFH/Band 7/PHB domain protein n=1 Tax=Romeriopsis navalis LEGE 11480 TaxID=2777977 RepID=A0A928Z3G2_9CYAN|nr:SPFH domain-containing protein [Romeriopsis navalis]MBE9029270.1 SPFH/Band 7/PHB domain protein [Romeriopsis navalis LEGE 11480]